MTVYRSQQAHHNFRDKVVERPVVPYPVSIDDRGKGTGNTTELTTIDASPVKNVATGNDYLNRASAVPAVVTSR